MLGDMVGLEGRVTLAPRGSQGLGKIIALGGDLAGSAIPADGGLTSAKRLRGEHGKA